MSVEKLRKNNSQIYQFPNKCKSSLDACSKKVLQSVIDSFPSHVLLVDSKHNILMSNKAVENSLGVAKNEIIGHYCPQVIHGLKGPFPGCPLEEAIKKNTIVEHDLFDEKYNTWLRSAIYPTNLLTPTGHRIYFHTVRDITTERQIKQDLEFKSMLLDSAFDSIFVHDFDGKMIYVNEAAHKTRGYSKKELLNLPLNKIDTPEAAKLIEPRIKLLYKKGKISFEAAHTKKNGDVIPVEVHAKIIDFYNKKVIASVIRDITERKQIETELFKAHHKLEDRVKERTAELSQANLMLEKEINEKKKAENELNKSVNKLKQTLEETVNALASIVETRDSYTAGHQKRVAQLATAIAKKMNLSKQQIEGINVAALLHDIGKLFVPSEILNKPSRLSDLEFSLIKTHCQVSYEILKSVHFPWPIAKIIIQHHERLNGSGYPNGTKDSKITLEAKIIAVADVVEAISSHRPYRAALGLDVALEEIEKNKGILYDKNVVDTCITLFKENNFKFIKKISKLTAKHLKNS